ncbi:hypothetical protein Msil_2169 [Methylocella silvestris BL2]|uniref:Uncharacterized protein n=2 Tax=Methylocella silvestris TaxID=199596 RepID=B8ESW9_METSB|nr:hypothetical protein Msil_2169 [Methylocella silvestris BL2]
MPNPSVPAAATGLPDYSLDILIADVAILHEVIGVAIESFGEIGIDQSHEKCALHRRVDALLNVAETFSQRIAERAERDIRSLRGEMKGRA